MTHEGHCRLGDLFTSRREKGRAGLPTLSVTLNDGLVNREDLDRKQDTTLSPEEHLFVKRGDIAYNMMRMWQGALGLATSDGMVSPAYVVLKPTTRVDPLYASFLFKNRRLLYLFWAYSYGLTDDRLRLYPGDFARIPAFVPPISEQKGIAQSLVTWDIAIEKVSSLIRVKNLEKISLVRDLLSGSRRLPGFTNPWRKYRICEMGRVISGGTPDTENQSYWGGEVLWATPTDIVSKVGRRISGTERQISEAGLRASSATLLPAGSILFCSRATIGELAIAASEIATNQGFKNLIPSKKFDADFLYYLFSANKNRFVRLACGSTFLELSKRDFERIDFTVPARDEQDAIASCITSVDDQISRLHEYLRCLNFEKAGLVQRLVSANLNK